jgi:type IV secretory pathway VirB2 component (pilin)
MDITGKRKFAVAVLAMLLASLMLWLGKIPPDAWASVMQWVGLGYIGAQAAQNAGISITNTKGSTNGTP